MIYYKKKNQIKKLLIKLKRFRFKNNIKFNIMSLFLSFTGLVVSIFLIFYLVYLFLLPTFFNENNIEKIANEYLSKNTKLYLDIKNPKIYPNYKFDINLKSDYIKLKYPNKADFVYLEKPNIDINLLTLFNGYIDLDKIKSSKAQINIVLDKNYRLTCFNYFPIDFLENDFNFKNYKLRNLKFFVNNFKLTFFDTNSNKNYYIVSKNVNFQKENSRITLFKNKQDSYLIDTKGEIKSNIKYIDYNLYLKFKLEPKKITSYFKELKKSKFDVFSYLDKYNFRAKANIDLKFKEGKIPKIYGDIFLKDYNFTINNVVFPKNNLELVFDGTKIKSDFNFKFLNEQFLKINTFVDFSKNQKIEAKISSNKINLVELKPLIDILNKLLNLKLNIDEFELKGFLEANLFAKINPENKSVISNGKLSVENANIVYKKFNIKLSDINSDIDFNNNEIKINKTKANINNSAFYLIGKIDNKTNLNLKINSDLLNISQILNLINSINIIPKNIFKDIIFKNGLMLLDINVTGNVQKPIIKSNSKMKNLELYSTKLKTKIKTDEINILANPTLNSLNTVYLNLKNIKIDKYFINIPIIKLKLLDDNISLDKFEFNYNGMKIGVISEISNAFDFNKLKLKLKISTDLIKNDFIIIKNKNSKLTSTLEISKDNIKIENLDIFASSSKLVNINGEICDLENFSTKNPTLKNINIEILNPLEIILPKNFNTKLNLIGKIIINGKIQEPLVNGYLRVFNFNSKELNLLANEIFVEFKNTFLNLKIDNAKIFDTNINLNSQIKYSSNKFYLNYLKFSSDYVDLDRLYNISQTIVLDLKHNNISYVIPNISAEISQLEMLDFILNDVRFNGEIKSNVLSVDNFKANACNGEISGSFILDILSSKVKSEVILKSINVRLLTSRFKEYSLATSGKISALIKANFESFEYEKMIRTMDGYIKFNVDDGELAQFAKLERFLQAGNILSQSILKLSLNSLMSAVTKQNTGYFKTIEGTIKVKDGIAYIQYINTLGSNMSTHTKGTYNILLNIANVQILGRIPSSIVSIMGEFGEFNTQKLVNKLSNDTQNVIKSLSSSPIEKILSIKISDEDYSKIPPLVNLPIDTTTREFYVNIFGNIKNPSSVKNFKWIVKDE